MKTPQFLPQARWIWHPADEAVNQYVDFVRDFELSRLPRKAALRVAVDSDYQVWINGTLLPGNQYRCYPEERVFNIHDVTRHLRRGNNRIAILAYFRGIDCGEYRLGRAGLLAQLDGGPLPLVTDSAWRCRLDPEYRQGLAPRTTPHIGFAMELDARRGDDWIQPGEACRRGWRSAAELAPPTDGFWKTLRARPLPIDLRMEALPGALIARGEFLAVGPEDPMPEAIGMFTSQRLPVDGVLPESTPASEMGQAFRRCGRVAQPAPGPWRFDPPAGKGRGGFALFDLGIDRFGTLKISVDAPVGTVVDVAHGEHLGDLGVRVAVNGNNYADRFICRAGRNERTVPFRRIGGRYLQMHIHFTGKTSGSVVVHLIGVVPREFNGPEIGSFTSDDRLLKAVCELSVKTLRLSMGDQFADCPTREQSLYAFDARNTALFNYYTFGGYEYAEESMRMLGLGARENGLLELCAPARVYCVIPTFSLAWICAVRDHYLFSGTRTLFREFEKTMERIVDVFLERRDPVTGLTRLFTGNPYWLFYEWAPGMAGYEAGQYCAPEGATRLDAPQNLHLIEAMDAVADMLGYEKREEESATWRRRTDGLRKSVRRVFYNKQRGLFASFFDKGKRWHYCASVQAQALVAGVVAKRQRVSLQRVLFSANAPGSTALIAMLPNGEHQLITEGGSAKDSMIPMTLSTLLYGVKALIDAPPEVQRLAYDTLMKIFGDMALKGATTLWETEQGSDAFLGNGSLCHAWSAAPLWFVHGYLLGVVPAEPGFKRFHVRPHAAGLLRAEGSVPTPHGPIHVRWRREGEKLQVKVQAPKNLTHDLTRSNLPLFEGSS